MGRDKATMEFQGQPLWERQLEVLRTLRPEKVFVSARTPPAWLPDNVELLLDDPPSRGPLSGLTKALQTIRTTHLIVLAVDMPFMTAGELGRLLESASDERGVVPIINDGAEPLAAIYPVTAAVDLDAALVGSDVSLQSVVRKLAKSGKIELKPRQEVSLYRSVNEAADLMEGRAF